MKEPVENLASWGTRGVASASRWLLGLIGVIRFGLVGLELASVMGEEIRDPRRTLPGAVVLAVYWSRSSHGTSRG